MNASAIARMSLDEKLRTMEALWDSLSKDEVQLESPSWHAGALQEAAARFQSGDETPIDWAEAKAQLRNRDA